MSAGQIGHRFDVWAPRPAEVAVVVDGQVVPMTNLGDGWWTAAVEDGDRELDYGFLLDGSTTPVADPRSRRQPQGVHGLSRTYDHTCFTWSDQKWTGRQLAGGLIYELHIGTFTPEGTFTAAIGKLDHLVSLGVSFVELLPVNDFNGEHNWGYDGVLWYAVHETYGGPVGYQGFVDACHAVGIAVIQDVVYNHLGPAGNHLPEFGPYLQDEHANTWGTSLNLDGADSDPVREFIIQNALMWLRDYHVDGLRLDAVHALSDHRAVHLLEELANEVDALSAHVGRPLTLIAESDLNDPKLITPRAAGGQGLTAQWSDDFHHVLHVALTGERAGYYSDFGSMASLAKVLTRAYFHDGTWSSFRGRTHGRAVDTRTTETWRFVVYAQDHDQIGNRAAGDRLTATLDRRDLELAAVMLLTAPFTPMLFMGEEWAATTPWQFFTSHPDEGLGELTAQNRIKEFARMGWDESVISHPQETATYANSILNWAEPEQQAHARMLDLYRRLATVRRDRPELTDPRFDRTAVSYDEQSQWLLMDRSGVLVAVNFSDEEHILPFTANAPALLLGTAEAIRVSEYGLAACSVVLPPHSAAVIASK